LINHIYLFSGIGLISTQLKMAGKKKKSTSASASATSTPPVLTRVDSDVETEMELLQVDAGDMVKLKQILDETVAGTFVEMDIREDHYLDNIKLTLMTVACAFAMIAQFSPVPFPECRPLLGVCCCVYFLLSGVLQLIATYLDRDAIMVTQPALEGGKNEDMKKYGLRIRTSMPRFDEFYSVVIEFQGLKDSPFVKKTWSVGQFFDAEGMFDEIGLMEAVEAVFKRFEKADYDKDDEKKKME